MKNILTVTILLAALSSFSVVAHEHDPRINQTRNSPQLNISTHDESEVVEVRSYTFNDGILGAFVVTVFLCFGCMFGGLED